MASLNTRHPVGAAVRQSVPLRAAQLPPQAPSAIRSNVLRTHEGAPALQISDELALRRSVCSCLLWEDTFYEDGEAVADRIVRLVGKVSTKAVADLAYDARTHMNLRHVPLLLVAALAAPKRGGTRLIGDTLAEVIQRPDELSEFLSIYARIYGVTPKAIKKKLSAQVKKGLARAFAKFDPYQLAKYDRDAPIKLRDVVFLSHVAFPGDPERGKATAQLVNNSYFPEATKSSGFRVMDEYGLGEYEEPKLAAPETWEVALSAGKDKKETFTSQIESGRLGYLALLRNLRNMMEAGVDQKLVEQAIIARRGARRVLPFRYVAAARACPQLTGAIDQALSEAITQIPSLGGRTVVLVDVSGSMDGRLSGKSDLTRMDVAATLASIIPGDLRVFTFSERCVEVSQHRGMAGIEAIKTSQQHGGTYLGRAIVQLQGGSEHYSFVSTRGSARVEMDRLICVTDEQSHDAMPTPTAKHAYLINVAPYRNGVGYGERWIHIDGFSEQVLRWISEYEKVAAS